MKIFSYLLICFCIPILFNGCSSTGSYISREQKDKIELGEIYKENVNYEGIKRNPVVIIHGFQGAELVDQEKNENVWGNFDATTMFYLSDNKMKSIAHPLEKGTPIIELHDTIVPNSILKKVHIRIFGIPLKFPAYEILIEVLKKAGYQPEEHPMGKNKHYFTLFEFAYDWRKDIPSNTKNLEKFLEKKRKYLQAEYEKQYGLKDFDVQFDVIAHSMGGLLARYYLQYGVQDLPKDGTLPKLNWGGNKYIDRLVVCGTPNAGYLDTFLELLRGGKLQPFTPALLGTLPTYYQMLPAPETKSIVYSDKPDENIDYFNPELWESMHWGLMNNDADASLKKLLPNVKSKEERKEIAKDHLKKCLSRAKQFIAAMKVDCEPPDDVQLFLVLGHGIKTSRKAFINRETGKIEKIEYTSGDGKITATSTIWDYRASKKWTFFLKSPIKWHNILAVRAAHMGILESSVFQDNILILLPMIESPKQKTILIKEIKDNIEK